MKAVLISIKPKWCELIASGKKTVEVRKTKPKLETPFKVYIYCTKDHAFAEKTLRGFDENGKAIYYKANKGKVIGEFVCYKVEEFAANVYTTHLIRTEQIAHSACLPMFDLVEYGINARFLYGWRISDLVIYDKPKDLMEFYRECEQYVCDNCPFLYVENTPNCYETWCEVDGKITIKRPPQSWCYVENIT